MVTVQELISRRAGEISQIESQLTEQEETISEQETQLTTTEQQLAAQERRFIRETQPLQLTLGRQASLASSVGIGSVAREAKRVKRLKLKAREETLPKFRAAEVEIEASRGQLAESRQQIIAQRESLAPVKAELAKAQQFERGRQLASVPGGVLGLDTREERRGFRIGQQQIESAELRKEQLKLLKTFETAGLKPIVVSGEIKGFDLIGKQASLPVENIGRLDKPQLEILEKAGLLTFKTEPPNPLSIVSQPQMSIQRPVEELSLVEKVKGKVGEFLTSPTQIPIFGGGGSIPITDITEPIKSDPETPFLLKGAAEFTEQVAGTPLRLAATTGIAGVLAVAPAAIRLVAGLGTTALGTQQFFQGETEAERAAGVIVGTLGLTATAFEAAPFISGALARLSPRFKPIRSGEVDIGGVKVDARFIEELKFDSGVGKIGLIPEGIGRGQGRFAPGAGALQRGGFGFKPGEQLKGFTGRELRLTTSQRGLIAEQGQFKVDPSVSDLGFFFTPADPVTGIPQTRVSRLGIQDLFGRPGGEVSFSLTGTGRPQIIVTEPTAIVATGRTGVGGVARITPKSSSELEVTALTNIRIVERLGVTTIKGQRTDIILGRLTPERLTPRFGPGRVGDIISSTKTTTISTGSIFGGTTGLITAFPRTSITTPTSSKGLTGSLSTRGVTSTGITSIGTPSIGVPSIGVPPTSPPTSPPTLDIPTINIPSIGTPSVGTPSIIPPPSRPPKRRGRERKRKKETKTKKRKKPRVPIRPSLTGIVLDIETPAIATETFGVSPFDIRGTRTGLAPKKKKKSVRKTKKRKKK